MITISENLIRSVRKWSTDGREMNEVERMLNSSPHPGATDDESNSIHPIPESDNEVPASHPDPSTFVSIADHDDEKKDTRNEEPEPAQIEPEPEPASVTNVIKFESVTPNPAASQASTSFTKVPVERKTLSSSLSRELVASATMRNARVERGHFAARSGPTLALQVFTEEGKPPMKMKISGSNTVEDVIELIIRQHTEQKRKPPLAHTGTEYYDLRMVDDDDGAPDMDIPPLDRQRDIHQMNVNVVALCERAEPLVTRAATGAATAIDNRKKRGVSLEFNMSEQFMKSGKVFLKVHMPKHVSHVIPVTPDMILADILPLIAKKRSAAEKDEISAQYYKFMYQGEKAEIDLKLPVSQLTSDELMMIPRVSLEEDKSISEQANNRPLTKTEAEMYQEFKVVKTNQRGKKQDRIMGISKDKIVNKNISGSNDDVQRAFRLISDVVSVEILADQPRSFRLTFRDKSNVEVREYEADTQIIAQRIVNKIKMLMS